MHDPPLPPPLLFRLWALWLVEFEQMDLRFPDGYTDTALSPEDEARFADLSALRAQMTDDIRALAGLGDDEDISPLWTAALERLEAAPEAPVSAAG